MDVVGRAVGGLRLLSVRGRGAGCSVPRRHGEREGYAARDGRDDDGRTTGVG